MKFVQGLSLTVLLVSMGACTWVKPQEGAENISLVKKAHTEACERLGKAHVSVKSKVALIERKSSKVAEELLTLAKNQAVSMGGDTLVSIDKPKDGAQSFEVYNCAK
ncbi:DUF4156 domain-containing protein [Agaribacterium sp. ZY112]|uniref:DUF4156 domain-containing protein n=1 Tax=Agaribacterium sp. ZY112 TaxID=3233574 RepID=UPI003524326D